jgi:hypothetical protein
MTTARKSRSRLLAYFRVDQRASFVRLFVVAFLFVALGSLVTGTGLALRGTPSAKWLIPLGVLVVALGPLWGIIGSFGLLSEEAYVALWTESFVWQRREDRLVVAWDALIGVRHEPATDAVVLALRDGAEVVVTGRYDGVTPRDLARQLEHQRRRSGLGLSG